MEELKILIVGNGATGNCQNRGYFINSHTGNFLKNLNSKYKITFLQYSSYYDKNNDLQNFDLSLNGIDHVELYGNRSLSTFKTIIKLVRENDFVYLFYPGTLGRIVGLVSILFGKKIGLYVRGEGFDTSLIDKRILSKSNFILTVSKYFKENLSKFCNKVDVIKPMISINKEDFFLRNYGRNKIKNFIYVGRVEENKGIYDLLDIMNQVNQVIPIKLNIVGGGDAFNIIKKRIEDQQLEYITLHGLISEKNLLKDLYNQSDAFIFTSHFEGFPRVLYEAMASGLPIFTTFVGGIPGLMKNNYNCLEIPVKDSKGASKVILSAYSNSDLLKRIGINGQNTLGEILDGDYLEHHELLNKLIK